MKISIQEQLESEMPYLAGYETSWDGDTKLTFTPKDDKKMMPTISCNVSESDGKKYLEPHMEFPKLDFEDMNYYDDFSYWLGKWSDLGRFLNALMKFEYDPDQEWYDEDEDSEEIATL